MTSETLSRILAADIHQIVVALICVIILLYVRLACGGQARYFVNLALAYIGISVVYLLDAITNSWLYFTGNPENAPSTLNFKITVDVVSSSLSLLNTMFFITAWKLMKNLRKEQELNPQTAKATLSNPFAASIIGLFATGIATYLGMTHLLIQSSSLRRIFFGVDVGLSALSIVAVGSEFLLIPKIRHHEEGSLFESDTFHAIFRGLTFLLFFLFGLLQFSFFFSEIPDRPIDFFLFPIGAAYYWLAALRILCAAAAAMLGLHALPSVRWKHKQKTTKRDAPPIVDAKNESLKKSDLDIPSIS